ncbi:hypothetical protein, partial [Serratia marcescens]|uniref:hypothetical protein n=1 Tax=Serratia marcescens TaxID=615 RepID=UPI0027E3F7DB
CVFITPAISCVFQRYIKKIGLNLSVLSLCFAFFGSLFLMVIIERYFSWFYSKINGIGVK